MRTLGGMQPLSDLNHIPPLSYPPPTIPRPHPRSLVMRLIPFRLFVLFGVMFTGSWSFGCLLRLLPLRSPSNDKNIGGS